MAGTIKLTMPPTQKEFLAFMERALLRGASEAIRIITNRTNKCVDAKGVQFKPYSRRYKTLKMAAGRDVSKVDLRLSGQLMRGIWIARSQPNIGRVVLGVRGTHVPLRFRVRGRTAKSDAGVSRIGNIETKRTILGRTVSRKKTTAGAKAPENEAIALAHHHGRGNLPRRRFFAIDTEDERSRIVRVMKQSFARFTREWNARSR